MHACTSLFFFLKSIVVLMYCFDICCYLDNHKILEFKKKKRKKLSRYLLFTKVHHTLFFHQANFLHVQYKIKTSQIHCHDTHNFAY